MMTIRKFDNRFGSLCRYLFEDNYDDEQRAYPLTVFAGTPTFRRLYEGVRGLSGGSTFTRNGVSDAGLRLFGDMTFNALCILRGTPSGTYLCSFAGSGETEAVNYAWSVQFADANRVAFFTEHGAGLDTVYYATPANRGLPAVNVPFLLTVRMKDGVCTVFVDGEMFGAPSPVLTAATGATTSQFVINQGTSTLFDVFCMEVVGRAITDLEVRDLYDYVLGTEFDNLQQTTRSLWIGGIKTDGASVMARLDQYPRNLALVATGSAAGPVSFSPASIVSLGAVRGYSVRFDLTGLDSGTPHTFELQEDGDTFAGTPAGAFKTLTSGAYSFMMAFSGDSITGTNHVVFDTIRGKSPDFFLQMGDLHYWNIATNDPIQFNQAFDQYLNAPRPNAFHASMPVEYVFDDHDMGPNNCDSTSASRPAATSVFRQRVPSHTLVEAGPNGSVYRSFDVGRVRFVLTDQRSAATPDSATDNSSKSMLGTAQKAWFKNILSNSSGMLIVWMCPRVFGWTAAMSSDSWGGFSTERTELANHIKANCHGRVIVLSADMHALGIDDGSHHDFATGGGEPLPTFQASPLDIAAAAGAGTYTYGTFANNGQFGTMEITDTGGSSIGVVWKGWDSSNNLLATHSFSVSV